MSLHLTHLRPFTETFSLSSDINKGSPIDYKSNVSQGSACSTPTKDTLKQYDRAYSGPMMVPTRGLFGSATNTLGAGHLTVGSQHHHHHYSTPLNFRKGFTSKCTWKCTAILVIMLCVILFSILVYMSGEFSSLTTNWMIINKNIFCSIINDELVISIIKTVYSARERETR